MSAPRLRRPDSGFTLLEVLIAIALFGVAVVAIERGRIISLRNVVESERLAVAVQLGSAKMTEMQIKYQRLLDKDGISSAYGEETGSFEAPYAEYKWKAKFAESKLQMGGDQLVKLLQTFGIDEEEAQAQVESQKLVLTNLNKMIKENFGELQVDIEWEQFGRARSFPLVTHLTPAKPKIELTTEAEASP